MAALIPEPDIRAAGGVVWRRAANPGPADLEVCLVHRQRHDDWSIPKGKLDRGEHPLAAAVREVFEETAVDAVPQLRLPSIRYVLPDGSRKLVDYWSMRVRGSAERAPDDEVDALRWVALPDALDTVSYQHEADVLRSFARLPPVTGMVLLVRHAKAGKRGRFPGPDPARPLDADGIAQAEALAPLLALYAPTRLVSAAPRRCVQTLDPLSAALDLPIEVDSTFDEGSPPRGAADRILRLTTAGGCTVVSSQGEIIPGTVARLAGEPEREQAYSTPKGGCWVLAFHDEALLDADRLGPVTPPS